MQNQNEGLQIHNKVNASIQDAIERHSLRQ